MVAIPRESQRLESSERPAVSGGALSKSLPTNAVVKHAHPLLPYESRFASIAGHQMHYLDEGEGPVLLCLHGNPTWCFYFREVIAKLKDRFRVIVPDFLGMGLSDRPKDLHFRARDRIEHIEALVEFLGLQSFSLLMHDWGGPIGSGYAVRHPEKIEKIVYLNTTLTETEALPGIIKRAATPGIGKLLTKYTKHFLKLTTGVGVSRKLPKDVRKAYLFPYKTSSRRQAIWDFVDDIPFDNDHPSYAEMLRLGEEVGLLQGKPVQIIWGLKDPCFHKEMLDKVARLYPSAKILEIPNASHLVLEDAPELAVDTIREFLLHAKNPSQEDAHEIDETVQNVLTRSFRGQAKVFGNRPACIEPFFWLDAVHCRNTSFVKLLELINKYERGLEALGLLPGHKVLMLVPAGKEFLALSYAVMGRGAIPVFLDPGIGREKLFQCIKDVNPDVFIGSPKAQLLRFKRKQLFPKLLFHVTASDWCYTGGPTLATLKRFSSRPLPAAPVSRIAFLAFTSGATGLPKGVVFTNEMLESQLEIFQKYLGIKAGTKDMPLLPIFSLFHLALGVCSVFPPMNPAKPLQLPADRIIRLIHELQIDSSFGSPTLWNKLAEYCVRGGTNFGSLQTLLMAGAPAPRSLAKRVQDLLPQGRAFTPYGATEALPVTVVSADEILSHESVAAHSGEIGTFVGRPLGELQLRVLRQSSENDHMSNIPSADEFCEPREIGEILVSGKNVSSEYFERPDANKAAKLHDGAQVWHRMGDMGYLDESGNLYFCGRKAHRVITPNKVYESVPVERIFNEHPMVKRSALLALSNQEAAIAIEPKPEFWPLSEEQRQKLAQELFALADEDPICEGIRSIFYHQNFPVDCRHNAKIFRDQLSAWAKSVLEKNQRESYVIAGPRIVSGKISSSSKQ